MPEKVSRVGLQVGHYRLVDLLGKGGFAEVYLGEHIHLNTQVAVKLLHAQIGDGDSTHFKQEAQTIARLLHPHIVRVLDFGIENTTPYLVMDYAPNGTLRQRHPRGTRLPLPTVVDYVKQMAEALQYAHDQRLIHRDIKPENMLIGRRDEILLSDFGIALVTQSSRYQQTQDIAGTIAYMAPEQIQAHPRPASDQYSLAIVVYEWLSGNRPFQGSYTEIAVKHTMVPPPPLRNHCPEIPEPVEQVVLIALQKDPRQRFASVRAFAQALEQASQGSQAYQLLPSETYQSPRHMQADISLSTTPPYGPAHNLASTPASLERSTSSAHHHIMPLGGNGQPAGAYPPGPPYPPGTFPGGPQFSGSQQSGKGTSRRAFLFGGLGLATVLSGAASWYLLNKVAGSSPLGNNNFSSGHNYLSSLAGATSNALVTYAGHTDYVWSVAWSPNGKYVVSGAHDGTAQVWNAENGQRVLSYRSNIQPAKSDNWVNTVTWSPDSSMIAVGFLDGTVQVVQVAEDKSLYKYSNGTVPGPSFQAVSWSPDGKYVAAGNTDNTIYIYDVAAGNAITTYTDHNNTITAIAWSHDGKRIVSGASDNIAKVWDPMSGKTLLNYDGHHSDVHSAAWSPDDTQIVTGATDGLVLIWDSNSGHTALTYDKHVGGLIQGVAWSHHGHMIASGGNDITTHVWDATTGAIMHKYNSAQIFGVAWSPDDTRIVTAGFNKMAQVWRIA